jgi:hypothetical protein
MKLQIKTAMKKTTTYQLMEQSNGINEVRRCGVGTFASAGCADNARIWTVISVWLH